MSFQAISSSIQTTGTPITMDDVPEFAAFLHQQNIPSNTYNIPNVLTVQDVEFNLYVHYSDGYWTKFVKTSDNSHQLQALQEFILSGEPTKTITVPHSHGGKFVATFKKLDPPNKNYNTIYTYMRENGTSVRFLVSYGAQIGFINRISCEPVG